MHDLDEYKDTYLKVNGLDFPDVCDGCSNNPKNGGSGICNCVLPYMQNPTNYNTQIGDSCMANNLNGYVYEVNTDHLDNMHQSNYDRINDAIKRIEKYVRK